jgi:hypothetical protein
MKFEGKSKRTRERLRLSLPIRVSGRETLGSEWFEMTRLLDVTPFGARFIIAHPTERGRLLHLTMPMPRQLRSYDHLETQYSVWALVRHVEMHAGTEAKSGEKSADEGARFIIGVAFIGKRPPASYEKDPTTRYEVTSSAWDSLCQVREKIEPEDGRRADRSKETRLQMPIEVVVEVLDEKGAILKREETVTENISRHGAAVFTSLVAERGRFIRLTGTRSGLSVLAVVRARRAGVDGIPRLHLEFVDREWPLEGVE